MNEPEMSARLLDDWHHYASESGLLNYKDSAQPLYHRLYLSAFMAYRYGIACACDATDAASPGVMKALDAYGASIGVPVVPE